MPFMDERPVDRRGEDELADMIAGAWHEIDKRAASETDEEAKKNENLLLELAAKLAHILRDAAK